MPSILGQGSSRIPMIPFNVFEEANLDLFKVNVVEQGKEEDFMLPRLVFDHEVGMLMPVKLECNYTYKRIPAISKKRKILKIDKGTRTTDKKDKKGNYKTEIYYNVKFLDLNQLENRHFVGAMVLELENKYYLFDVDRRELKYYRFNPFLTEVNKPVKSIKEAYKSLIPYKVTQALRKGLKVKRQGEWFFIPTNKKLKKEPQMPKKLKKLYDDEKEFPREFQYDMGKYVDTNSHWDRDNISVHNIKKVTRLEEVKEKYHKAIFQRIRDYNKSVRAYRKKVIEPKLAWEKRSGFWKGAELKAGENAPNEVEYLWNNEGVSLVKGKVEHTGREHEDLNLRSVWHIAIPNTAIKSFTISGNID